MRFLLPLIFGVSLSQLGLGQPVGKGDDMLASGLCAVGDQKQLLFDDSFLESHKGFWWRVCPPRKTGEKNLIADKPWESFVINAWVTVMKDKDRYRMWYEAYDKGYKSDYDARYCYAESTDGIHWDKPVLGIESFDGSKENNILFQKLGGRNVHGGTVFKDPNAQDKERYKFVFLSDGAVWGAFSPDGIHWTLYDQGPILHVSSDTQTVCFWDDLLKKYVTYCRMWTPNRTIGRSESSDFLHFPNADMVLACDERDPADTDLYNSACLKYPFAANAYFIFTSAYHHTADNVDVQLAVSRDGIHWSRPERNPFIPNGEPGSVDDASIYAGVGVLRKGDDLSMIYYASRIRHNQNSPQWVSSQGVYTRAVLTLDRYVSMQANLEPAEFVTHPLVFSGIRLELNADVGPEASSWPEGFIKVELQDEAGHPLPGFSLEECVPVEGNSVRHQVSWKKGSDLSPLAGKKIKMRCQARDACLYAFQFCAP